MYRPSLEPTPFCCALVEFYGLNDREYDTRLALVEMCRDGRYHTDFDEHEEGHAHVILAEKYTRFRPKVMNLDKFTRYVRRYKLGTVVTSPAKRNPNSGNKVVTAIFTPHRSAMGEWWKKQKEFGGGIDTNWRWL